MSHLPENAIPDARKINLQIPNRAGSKCALRGSIVGPSSALRSSGRFHTQLAKRGIGAWNLPFGCDRNVIVLHYVAPIRCYPPRAGGNSVHYQRRTERYADRDALPRARIYKVSLRNAQGRSKRGARASAGYQQRMPISQAAMARGFSLFCCKQLGAPAPGRHDVDGSALRVHAPAPGCGGGPYRPPRSSSTGSAGRFGGSTLTSPPSQEGN